MKTYEAMLVVNPTVAAREWDRVSGEIDHILKRHGASMLHVARWGERKLAYPVRKSNRGAFVLTYFTAPPEAIPPIRADLQLSEVIFRSLVVEHEGEQRREVPKDFETAGPLPPRMDRPPGGGDTPRGGRPWEARPPMPVNVPRS